jgi:hypothetical protein
MAYSIASFLQDDRARVDEALTYLSAQGHDVWVGAEPLMSDVSVLAGEVLRNAAAVVVFVSRASLDAARKAQIEPVRLGFSGALAMSGRARRSGGAAAIEHRAVSEALATPGRWGLYDALVAIGVSKLIVVLVDAETNDLPAPMGHLPAIDLAQGQRALHRLHRAVLRKERRQTRMGGAIIETEGWRALIEKIAVGEAIQGFVVGAISAAATIVAALFAPVGEEGKSLWNSIEDLQSEVATLDGRVGDLAAEQQNLTGVAGALRASDARQAAMLAVLGADIYSEAACEPLPALEVLRLTEEGRFDLYTVRPGQGIYQVAAANYGANPHRVANLIFFANRDYFCRPERQRPVDRNFILGEGVTLRIPRLQALLPDLPARLAVAPP